MSRAAFLRLGFKRTELQKGSRLDQEACYGLMASLNQAFGPPRRHRRRRQSDVWKWAIKLSAVVRLSAKRGSNNKTATDNIAVRASSGTRRYWSSGMLRFALRGVPRSWRFQAALWSARLLAPVIRTTAPYRERRTMLIDGPVEIALYLILAGLVRHGIDFELRLRVLNFERFEAAVRSGRGVLLISPHGVFGLAFLRYLDERGYHASVVSPFAKPDYPLAPKVPVQVITPGRSFLFEVRERFRKGEVVGAMIDRAEAVEGHTFPVEVRDGTLHLASALIHVAENAAAEVIFLRSWVEDNAIVIELASPSSSPKGGAESIARDFAQFIQRHVSTGANR